MEINGNELVWLINAKSDTEVNMSITYESKLPQDAVYRGIEKDGKQLKVYNTATSPDRDYRPVVN
jgi:hypothetical protein